MRRRAAARIAKLEKTVHGLANLRQADEEAITRLRVKVAHLQRRVTALEQHIIAFGPEAKRSDPSAPGWPSWEEPYRVPDPPG